jgi:hypothetical protein
LIATLGAIASPSQAAEEWEVASKTDSVTLLVDTNSIRDDKNLTYANMLMEQADGKRTELKIALDCDSGQYDTLEMTTFSAVVGKIVRSFAPGERTSQMKNSGVLDVICGF